MPCSTIVYALAEKPIFGRGDNIRILSRSPIGHYRVPIYLRGKTGVVESVIEPTAVDNEEEGSAGTLDRGAITTELLSR